MTFVNQKVERLGLSVQDLDTQVGGSGVRTPSPSLSWDSGGVRGGRHGRGRLGRWAEGSGGLVSGGTTRVYQQEGVQALQRPPRKASPWRSSLSSEIQARSDSEALGWPH